MSQESVDVARCAARLVVLAALVLAGAAFGCGESSSERTRTYEIPSEAMLPTLDVGDEVTVNLDAYSEAAPEPGDIVTFHPPQGAVSGDHCGPPTARGQMCSVPTPREADDTFIKRVVAGPGDAL